MNKAPLPRYISFTYSHRRLRIFFEILSPVLVILTAVSFIAYTVYLAHFSVWRAIGLAVIALVPYVFVTLFRRWFDAPRPSELYDFSGIPEELHPKKRGRSFPSRHVFSAFVIGVALSFVHLYLGIAVMLFGLFLAAFRVLLGIHFVRDVVAGALIGIVSGILGTLIVNYGILPIFN